MWTMARLSRWSFFSTGFSGMPRRVLLAKSRRTRRMLARKRKSRRAPKHSGSTKCRQYADRIPDTARKQERSTGWRVGEHPGVERAPFSMCFTPRAFAAVLRTVGCRRPEAGAKGFGPLGAMGIDVVEFDQDGSAAATGGVYSPDHEWGGWRQEFHLNRSDESARVWTCDIHSHPGAFGSPSPARDLGKGDLGYVKEVFRQNEWMKWFMIPILTGTGRDGGEVVVHPWVCLRDERDGADDAEPRLMIADLRICDVSEFPEREYREEWERKADAQPLTDATAAENCLDDRGELTKEEPAAQTKHNKGLTLPGKPDLLREYTSRLRGIVSPDFHTKTILTVGVGAGSYAVEKLARLCPARLKICDFDIVEVSNLARTSYSLEDAFLGRLKVDALARRIEAVNPLVEVGARAQHPRYVRRRTPRALRRRRHGRGRHRPVQGPGAGERMGRANGRAGGVRRDLRGRRGRPGSLVRPRGKRLLQVYGFREVRDGREARRQQGP